MNRIDGIQQRLESATQGKWSAILSEYGPEVMEDHEVMVCRLYSKQEKQTDNQINNALFIAAAPDDIRFLLDEVERLTKGLEFYASKENNDWNIDGFDEVLPSKVMQDDGEIARQTLKGASL